MAGLPTHTGGATINRLCGSSLQAINQATHAIMAGFEDVQIVGGLEHMQHMPMDRTSISIRSSSSRTSKGALCHGSSPPSSWRRPQGISREEQDAFAVRSHQRAAAAQAKGEFKPEIVPVWGRNEQGRSDAHRSTISASAPIAAWKASPRSTGIHAGRRDRHRR